MSGYVGYLAHKWGLQIVGRKEDAQILRVKRALRRCREHIERIKAGKTDFGSHSLNGSLPQSAEKILSKGIASLKQSFGDTSSPINIFLNTSSQTPNQREIMILANTVKIKGGLMPI